jgi:hypothetical protein
MTRFQFWFRWKYRFMRCVWLCYRGKCQSYAEAFDRISDRFPLTYHEYVYDQMARERGRAPSPWDPPPKTADVVSFMMLWSEHHYEGMSGQEILNEVNTAEGEWHEKMRAFVERAGQQAREKHDLA